MNETVTNIISKIEKYDENNGTEFADIVTEKLEEMTDFNSEYRRGLLHGILLALTHLEVISAADSIEILDEVRSNEV